jgi:hypothetical protein
MFDAKDIKNNKLTCSEESICARNSLSRGWEQGYQPSAAWSLSSLLQQRRDKFNCLTLSFSEAGRRII